MARKVGQIVRRGAPSKPRRDMANHFDPRTTKLYDSRKDLATLGEIERRIAF